MFGVKLQQDIAGLNFRQLAAFFKGGYHEAVGQAAGKGSDPHYLRS